MDDTTALTPLLRWDGLHLVLNLAMVERFLQRRLDHLEWLDGLWLDGSGDTLRVRARLRWRRLSGMAHLDLGEIRLRNRHLGFRFRRSRAPGHIALPRPLLEMALDAIETDLVKVIRGHGIVVVDLRRWIPPEVVLSIRAVQATRSYLHVWLGPGVVCDLPGAGTLRLPANEGE